MLKLAVRLLGWAGQHSSQGLLNYRQNKEELWKGVRNSTPRDDTLKEDRTDT